MGMELLDIELLARVTHDAFVVTSVVFQLMVEPGIDVAEQQVLAGIVTNRAEVGLEVGEDMRSGFDQQWQQG
jgi:hypothetical protein